MCIGIIAAAATFSFAQQGRKTWSEYGGGPDNSRYLTLTQINKSNLDRLDVAWTYPTSDTVSYVFNPVIVDSLTVYRLSRWGPPFGTAALWT